MIDPSRIKQLAGDHPINPAIEKHEIRFNPTHRLFFINQGKPKIEDSYAMQINMDYDRISRILRRLGRRSGGDRRCFEYAMVIPERRKTQRRITSRRKACTGQFNGR